jgi:hypothetical protein
MLGTFPTQRRSIFYNMHIFIDESGRFISNDGFSAVCALSIPDKSTGPLRREILRISKHWPREEGELKGGLLAVDHLIALTEVLYHHDALLDCCAIDVSLETAALVPKAQSYAVREYYEASHERTCRRRGGRSLAAAPSSGENALATLPPMCTHV